MKRRSITRFRLATKGPDDQSNWAVVFARANESKQAAHLYVARVLNLLDVIREKANDPRGANLGDVLAHFGGAKHPLYVKAVDEKFQYKLTQMNLYDEFMSPIWFDELSRMRTTFLRLPIEYMHHDHKINPRAIGNSIRGLIEEFHRKRPQLHIPLAWIDTKDSDGPRVRIFDGQHKAAAQILLDQKWLPVRVFLARYRRADHDEHERRNEPTPDRLRQIHATVPWGDNPGRSDRTFLEGKGQATGRRSILGTPSRRAFSRGASPNPSVHSRCSAELDLP